MLFRHVRVLPRATPMSWNGYILVLLAIIIAIQFGCAEDVGTAPIDEPTGPDLNSVSYSLLEVSTGNVDVAQSAMSVHCDLGGIACGEADARRLQYHLQGYGAVWKNNPAPKVSLTMNGRGHFVKGDEFPVTYDIACQTKTANLCSDSEEFYRSCSVERNELTVSTASTASTLLGFYLGRGSDEIECDDNPGGGTPGGWGDGPDCTTEMITIEVWNEDTDMWDVLGTYPVEVCA